MGLLQESYKIRMLMGLLWAFFRIPTRLRCLRGSYGPPESFLKDYDAYGAHKIRIPMRFLWAS